jgi:hypothetical protein
MGSTKASTQRERIMKRFKSPRQVQRLLSIHDQIANVFSRRPNQDTAAKFHTARSQALPPGSRSPAWQWRLNRASRQPPSHPARLRLSIDDKLTVPRRLHVVGAATTVISILQAA